MTFMRRKQTFRIPMDPPLLIKYTATPAPNIYFTNDESHVTHNNDFLGLGLHEFDNMPHGIDIQRFRMYIVYTSKRDWKYEQHIFLNSADKKYIREFAETLTENAKAIMTEIAGL
jgi:hypothetical protein